MTRLLLSTANKYQTKNYYENEATMKRVMLIAGGTLGGLGAVLAITPPQLSSTSSLTGAGTAAATPKTSTPKPAATQTPKAASGVFSGPSVYVNYGNVQVQITVSNGRITNAVALQAPSGRNDRFTQMAIPILKQQTLAAQSDQIQGASGASYTSYGWFKSLQGALAKAGL